MLSASEIIYSGYLDSPDSNVLVLNKVERNRILLDEFSLFESVTCKNHATKVVMPNGSTVRLFSSDTSSELNWYGFQWSAVYIHLDALILLPWVLTRLRLHGSRRVVVFD